MKKINIKLTLTDKTALAITKYADSLGHDARRGCGQPDEILQARNEKEV